MGQKNYKKNEPIRVLYRAIPGSTSVNMDVFDETDTLDSGQSGAMAQFGTSDRWTGVFTPGENGNWSINCTDDKGGSVPKDYSIGDYNIDSVGAGVATVESKVDLTAKTTELSAAETNIRGADSDTLKTLSDQIDALPQTSPPMIG